MVKNWLIRTKSNHILGPVSREKVMELMQNGSIKSEDEVCSGNGYWFHVREKDLVERFLIRQERQPFNPISEAPDVLGDAPSPVAQAYSDDITLLTSPDLSQLRGDSPPAPPSTSMHPTREGHGGRGPAVEPPEVPEEEPEPAAESTSTLPLRQHATYAAGAEAPLAIPTPTAPGRAPQRRRPAAPSVRAPAPAVPRRFLSDKAIMFGAVVALIALATVLYYRKRLLREFLEGSASLVVPTAHAQDGTAKKKTFFPAFPPLRPSVSK